MRGPIHLSFAVLLAASLALNYVWAGEITYYKQWAAINMSYVSLVCHPTKMSDKWKDLPMSNKIEDRRLFKYEGK